MFYVCVASLRSMADHASVIAAKLIVRFAVQ
jgi:hypothetical protein